MAHARNLTRFALACVPSMSLDGRSLALLVVAGTYELPRPGSNSAPVVLDEQPEAPLAPTYHGDPGNSSLIWESQAVPGRPGTDIYVDALAWGPGGRPVTSTTVAIRLGQVSHQAAVFDAAMVSPRRMTFTLIWRATVPTSPDFFELEAAVVRSLEAWEAPP